MIEVNNLTVTYPDGRAALDRISFTVKHGESIALLGCNGAGKSTLLLALVGVVRGNGSIAIDNKPLEDDTLPEIRRRVQLLFQNPDDQLFMPLVKEDVAFGPLNFGVAPDEVDNIVKDSLDIVGLSEYLDRPTYAMSYGEKKRAALAGVLACRPEVILLDEPSAGLDPKSRRELSELLKSVAGTKIIATHDLQFASMCCDNALVLHKGKIAAHENFDMLIENEALLKECGLV